MPCSVPAHRLRLLAMTSSALGFTLFLVWGELASADSDRSYHDVAVSDNVLTLPALPDLRVSVSDGLSYLGSTSFPLGDRAEADVFIFAERDGAEIRRLVTIQVESLTDESARDYHWEGVDTLGIGGADYVLGYWCFDAADVARERPGGDTAAVLEWLAANGHRKSGVFVGTRLARVFADGRSELLLFYGETTAITGVDCEDEEAAMKHLPSIVGRSEGAFTIEE